MRLKEQYKKEILPKLKEKFGFKNNFQAPKLEKVVLNVGFGKKSKEKSFKEKVVAGLIKISGQKPVIKVWKLVLVLL